MSDLNNKEKSIILSSKSFTINKVQLKNEDNSIAISAQRIFDDIIDNLYKVIVSQYEIAYYCLENRIYVPTICFNVYFLLEVFLKYQMFLNYEDSKIENLKFNHNLFNYIKMLSSTNCMEFKELESILAKEPHLNKHYHLKYNFDIEKTAIIMNEEEFKNSFNCAKEVFRWVKKNLNKE